VAPELAYLTDFFGWLQCGERLLMELSALDAPHLQMDRSICEITTAKAVV